MIDCLNAAHYFIIRAYEDGMEAEMTNMKIQKLEVIERENPDYESVMSEVLKNALNSESSTRVGKGEVHEWLNSLLD